MVIDYLFRVVHAAVTDLDGVLVDVVVAETVIVALFLRRAK